MAFRQLYSIHELRGYVVAAMTPATQTAWIERSVASATLSIYLHKNSTVCLSASAV